MSLNLLDLQRMMDNAAHRFFHGDMGGEAAREAAEILKDEANKLLAEMDTEGQEKHQFEDPPEYPEEYPDDGPELPPIFLRIDKLNITLQ